MSNRIFLDGSTKDGAFIWSINIASDVLSSSICIDPSSSDNIIVTVPAPNSAPPAQLEIPGDNNLQVTSPNDNAPVQIPLGDQVTIDMPANGGIIVEIPRGPSSTGKPTIKVKQGQVRYIKAKNIRSRDL